ncbi:serine/threonine-protein kinase [Blastococcus sp. SYSU D00695]
MGGPVRRVLGERYELRELLATGGMGRVWRACDLRLGRTVAVKLLRSEYTDDEVSLARFRAEAQLSAQLVHPNIAALHDYGEVTAGADPGAEVSAYLVMELVEGESLATRLAREPRPPVALVLDVLDQTAAALAAAHAAGVVHRDVKPGNVLLGDDGVVRITDFGIAWTSTSAPLTRTGQVVGTASYLSPEQAEGRQAGPASDVYALGMVAYECLAGERAFDGESPVQIALRQIREEPAPLPADVPENVRRLVDRMLVKDPAGRLADGAAVRAAVADVRAGRRLDPVRAPRTRVLPVPVRSRGRRALVPLATLLVGAGLGVGLLSLTTPADPGLPAAAAGTGGAAGSPAPVEVTAAELVGRPADEVAAELTARGLQVARQTAQTAASAPGLVTAVGPTGALAAGTRVTLTVAVAPPAPSSVPPSVPPVSVPQPVPPSVPSSSVPVDGGPATADPGTSAAVPPAAEAPAPAPGGGQGNGHGNGNGHGSGNGGGQGNGNGNGGGNGRGNGRG